MIRSQSVSRVSYKDLSERIERIKAASKAHSNFASSVEKQRNSPRMSFNIPGLPPRPASSHRGSLKANENGLFGYDANN